MVEFVTLRVITRTAGFDSELFYNIQGYTNVSKFHSKTKVFMTVNSRGYSINVYPFVHDYFGNGNGFLIRSDEYLIEFRKCISQHKFSLPSLEGSILVKSIHSIYIQL